MYFEAAYPKGSERKCTLTNSVITVLVIRATVIVGKPFSA